MHGWAGRFSQFSEMIEALINGGFKVIGIDAPGHGLSGGKETSLPEFARAIEMVIQVKGPIAGAIGHSLGGVSLLLSRKNGLEIPKIVTISMPSVASGIITEFLKKINGSQKTGEGLRKEVIKKFNKSFDDFSAISIVSKDFPKSDVMLIHDENDLEAPLYHFWEISKFFPEAKTKLTKGFGHNKILRDWGIAAEIIQYIKDKEKEHHPSDRHVLQEK
jgi:pimeloyl-ACP methyl ester carboxylesterase